MPSRSLIRILKEAMDANPEINFGLAPLAFQDGSSRSVGRIETDRVARNHSPAGIPGRIRTIRRTDRD